MVGLDAIDRQLMNTTTQSSDDVNDPFYRASEARRGEGFDL